MTLRAYRHARANLTAAGGAELTRSFGRTFREEISDCGAGSFMLANTDAQLTSVTYGDFVKIVDDANPAARFFMVVEKRRRATVDEAEEWGQTTVFEGRGHLAVLEEGLILPEWFGAEGEPVTDSRVFNFSSRYLDDSAWPFAVVSDDSQFGTPQDWWDVRDGDWIWDRTVNGAFTAPIGDCFFRRLYSTATSKQARIFIAADDLYELWHNNALLTSETEWYHGQSKHLDVTLTAGDNLFAIKATNVNVAKAGVKFAMYELDSANEPGTLLLQSNATWRCKGYPSPEPGYTPGGILKQAIFEMGSTGIVAGHKALTDVTLGFDAFNDSDGVAWTTTTDFATRIGTSILDVARALAEVYIDVAMDPDSLRLEAWLKGTRGGASGVELYAGTGGSLTSLVHEGQG